MSGALKILCGGAIIALLGCHATVKHEVEPIHITLDVNLKVDRELEDFFAFQDQIKQEVLEQTPPTEDEGQGEAPP